MLKFPIKVFFIAIILWLGLSNLVLAAEVAELLPDLILDPGPKPGVIFVVEKSTQELRIYRHDGQGRVVLEKVIPCSTGMNHGDKLLRGDKKTPDGYYIFRQKLLPGELPAIYGILAYPMDYPNFWDQHNGRGGDGIWTHGVNKPLVDYDSNGCIELHNHDLASLEEHIFLYDTPILVTEQLNLVPTGNLKKEANAVRDFVEGWCRDWAEKRLDSYQARYDRAFINSENRSFDGWMSHKKNVVQGYKKIEIKLDDLKIFRHRDVLVASFIQNYQGDNRFASIGLKRLYLKPVDDGYRIVAEEFVSPLPAQPDKWLTAAEKHSALTTPPLAVAGLNPPVLVASAGVILPEPPVVTGAAVQDTAGAAADESARAALEVQLAGSQKKGESQAEEILAEQTSKPETTKAADVPVKKPVVKIEAEEEPSLEDLVIKWSKLWSSKDQNAYFALYDESFYFADLKMKLSAFKKYRSQMMDKASKITISVRALEVSADGDKARVSFVQDYQADQYHDSGLKTLTFINRSGRWKITGETWQVLR